MSGGRPNDKGSPGSIASQIAQAYRTAHEVVSAAASLGLLVFAGVWLDGRFGCRPALTICGAVLGFIAAGVALRQLLNRLDRESRSERRKPYRSSESDCIEEESPK